MLFWHVGGAVFLFRVLFKDPGVDLRFLAAGALLPDAVDALVGLTQRPEPFLSGRFYGHSLILAVAVLAVGMWVTDRGSTRRRRAVAAAVGIMFHLLLDAMWLWPAVLLWPIEGGGFLVGSPGDWSGLPGSLLDKPLRLVQELAGLSYLAWLFRRAALSETTRRSRLWRTGTIIT